MKNPGAAPAPQNGEFEMTNPPPSTSEALLHAILSMDSYNRSYNAGVEINAQYIGDVTYINDSVLLGDDAFGREDESISFYAAYYEWEDQKIISYRGTDDGNPLEGDPNYGYALALGDYTVHQAEAAIDFYRLIVPQADLLTENITLTGHSLGGGLAGFVAGMYHREALIFAQMPYEGGLSFASDATDPMGAEYDPVFTEHVYGTLTPVYPTISNHQAYSIQHEALSYVRGLFANNTDHITFDLSTNDTSLDLVPYDFDWWDLIPIPTTPYDLIWTLISGMPTTFAEVIVDIGQTLGWTIAGDLVNEAVARHSQATMVLRLLFEKEDGLEAPDWKAAGEYFWPLLYDHEFANTLGGLDLPGVSLEREKYADIMRTVLAYSAVEADNGLVFGNTGARALHDDSNDLARALSASGSTTLLENLAKDITKAYVHYSTHLALSDVEVNLASTAFDERSGILSYSETYPNTLKINFISSTNTSNNNDWAEIRTDLKETMSITRNPLVEKIFAETVFLEAALSTIDLDAFIKNNGWFTNTTLEGESSAEVFNRIIFAATDSGSEELALEEIGEYYKGTLYVGSEGDDTLTLETGSNDRTVFIGNGGTDLFIGGDSLDIAIGGTGYDVLDGKAAADFLYGNDGNDTLIGGTGFDIVIGGTGNDDFIASGSGDDIYHGGYDQEELAPHWNVDPFDMEDLTRQEDGLDKVDYTSMGDVAFEVTLIDASLGNYFVDKYYSGTLHSGTWDRDLLYSIEILDIDVEYRHDAGGAVHVGDSGNNNISYVSHGGGNYNVAYSFYGYGGIDNLWGGHENDLLVGGTDNDTVSGNDGDDTYIYNLGDGADTVNDLGRSTDYDTIMFGVGINPWETTLGRYHTDKMTITFVDQSFITVDNQNSNGFGIDSLEFMDGTVWDMQGTLVTVYGTGGDDNLAGTTESAYREGSLVDDLVFAGGGIDYVNGFGGNDTIYGGDGNDHILHGGYGDDIIYGEDGDDTINGGHDNDTLYGGIGNDTINGGEDEDIIYGDAGIDILKGDNHDDIIYGGDGDDIINGGNGVDSLYGDADNDIINGDNGHDIIYGGGGNDTLIGGTADAGNDILVGGDGNDTLSGYNGADTLYGGSDLDTMTGGGGADTFVFESASAFSNIDVITDFKQSESDKLDISDILSGFYDYGVDVITDFVQITQSGATAYLSINQNGSGGGSYVQIATLTGLGTQNLTDEAALEASGRLITHV